MEAIVRGTAAAFVLLILTAAPLVAASSVGPEFRVNNFTLGGQTRPDISHDAAGSFVVIWDDLVQDTSNGGVFGHRFDSLGMPQGDEFQVNTVTVGNQRLGAVSHDVSGNFVVVWDSNQGGSYGVFGQRFDSSGLPQGSEFLVNNVTGYGLIADVSHDSSGGFVVVWESGDGSFEGIFGQRFDSLGIKQGLEFQVNSHTVARQRRPAISHDPASGSFVVVWNSTYQDGSDNGIFGQRFDSLGMKLGGEFQVNSHTTGSQYHKDVSHDSAGNFVVVWQGAYQDGGPLWGIFGQRFDSLGMAQGGEFQINSYTTSSQAIPAVSHGSAGSFVIVWESLDQDGNGLGIFGQEFDSQGAKQGGEFQINSLLRHALFCGEFCAVFRCEVG
jgi:hypothetical protein